mmetsp:Transcript_31318/g.79887  ORF Transcript_31318/g.79887 Transcript_31318/m.79887 type:complete len:264 (-) Transcript_31318:628-1419(-)
MPYRDCACCMMRSTSSPLLPVCLSLWYRQYTFSMGMVIILILPLAMLACQSIAAYCSLMDRSGPPSASALRLVPPFLAGLPSANPGTGTCTRALKAATSGLACALTCSLPGSVLSCCSCLGGSSPKASACSTSKCLTRDGLWRHPVPQSSVCSTVMSALAASTCAGSAGTTLPFPTAASSVSGLRTSLAQGRGIMWMPSGSICSPWSMTSSCASRATRLGSVFLWRRYLAMAMRSVLSSARCSAVKAAVDPLTTFSAGRRNRE